MTNLTYEKVSSVDLITEIYVVDEDLISGRRATSGITIG